MFRHILRRLRNLEKPTGLQIQNGNLRVKSVNTSGDMNAGGNVTGANVSAFGTVSGTNVNASAGVTAPQGTFSAGVTSTGTRTKTLTNSPVQVYVDAAGNLGVSASTLAKKNVTGPYQVDMAKFLAVELKTWAYKDNPQATGMGPIADALDAAGLTEFVLYNLDGTIQGVRSDMLIVGLWSAYGQSRSATLAEFNKRMVQTFTNSSMTALGINAEKTYDVTWPKEFADTNYAVTASVTSSGAVLGALCALVPGSKTTKGCKVSVRSIGIALLANNTLTVEAIHV